MKYRTKLYIAFIAMIFTTTFIGLGLVYWEARDSNFSDLRSNVLTVAATAAQGINGDLLEKIQEPQDTDTPAFKEIAHFMKEVRDANRRTDLYVIWIYTLRPNPDKPDQLEIGIEASDKNYDEYVFTREAYPEGVKAKLLNHIHQVWATPNLISDRWGSFLTGLAPIYNGQGQYVSTLGVDLSSQFVMQQLDHFRDLALITLIVTLLGGFFAATVISHIVTRSLATVARCVDQIGHGDLKMRVKINTQDEFGELAHSINDMAEGLEVHERLKANFIRYVSKHVMDVILTSEKPPSLKGERRTITVLFSDIREFTRLAEQLPAEEVIAIFNEFLDAMLDVVFKNNGTLDKFIEDGLMVEFGVPIENPKQEAAAVKTAIEMQRGLEKLVKKWVNEGRPEVHMGIGIHTGPAVVGNIGSERRMEYTAIGDTVNVASRLEKATKELKVPILISETTKEAIGDVYKTKNLGSISLPGRDQPITVYSIEI